MACLHPQGNVRLRAQEKGAVAGPTRCPSKLDRKEQQATTPRETTCHGQRRLLPTGQGTNHLVTQSSPTSPVSQSSPECPWLKAPASVRGVRCVAEVEVNNLSTSQ